MTITEYTPEYADAIADLFTAAVHALDAAHYSPDQKAGWAPKAPNYLKWRARLEQKRPFLALSGGSLIGFLELEKGGHIDCFYVSPDHQRSGIGRELFRHAEAVALAEKYPRIYVEASYAARHFFLKHGFSVLKENQVRRGTELLNNCSMQRLRGDLQLRRVEVRNDIPFDLFMLADPLRQNIETYLVEATVFILLREAELVCGYILTPKDSTTVELKNIVVAEKHQGQGFGKLLLSHAQAEAARLGFQELLIGTGNSSLNQLGLYQRAGFEVRGIKPNFFVENYPEPIWENGIQCKHMIMLAKSLVGPC